MDPSEENHGLPAESETLAEIVPLYKGPVIVMGTPELKVTPA